MTKIKFELELKLELELYFYLNTVNLSEITPREKRRHPRAFFAFLFTERLFTIISEPGTGYS